MEGWLWEAPAWLRAPFCTQETEKGLSRGQGHSIPARAPRLQRSRGHPGPEAQGPHADPSDFLNPLSSKQESDAMIPPAKRGETTADVLAGPQPWSQAQPPAPLPSAAPQGSQTGSGPGSQVLGDGLGLWEGPAPLTGHPSYSLPTGKAHSPAQRQGSTRKCRLQKHSDNSKEVQRY